MEGKLKLLEMIQDVIKRMANNSFLLKGWTVTIIGAMITLFERSSGEESVLAFFIPIVMFWTLDSYYLQMERKFRLLYYNVANTQESQLDFSIPIEKSKRADKTCYYQCLLSKTEITFYVPLAILTVFVSATSAV